jgi:energy-coupling factor transporter ATP-binding protein EcfA2
MSKNYDIFISYAEADRAWVEGYLLDALLQADIQCHREASFRLGVPLILEFEYAVKQSERTLLVLSPAYLTDGISQFTTLLVEYYGVETGTWPVIPLILHPVKLPPTLAMLSTLDATDREQWPQIVERLCAELQHPVPAPLPKPECPYPGMMPFTEDDSDRFFGRDQEVEQLLQQLNLYSFVTVIGPSGSGKSSLVLAGLIPALRRSGLFGAGEWLIRTIRPSETPLTVLARELGGNITTNPALAVTEALATHGNAQRLLLIVDQFEEVFTLAGQEAAPFEQALLRLVETPNCYVILTVRADFYPQLMESPLWSKIQSYQYRLELVPLDEKGLRKAIRRPAEDIGVFIEAALIERLVAEATGEPGVLPLIQETLRQLWDKLERRFLPFKAYEMLVLLHKTYQNLDGSNRKGLQAVIGNRADQVIVELDREKQRIARRIFLRLIQFGEGRADTRRQQSIDALHSVGDDPSTFKRTIHHLADNRLLTLSGEEDGSSVKVDIAHEALIEGWTALQCWLQERREAEQIRRRLVRQAQEWVRLGKGDGGLLDEVELAEAEHWLKSDYVDELGYDEDLLGLIETSRQAIQDAKEREEASRQREYKLLQERMKQEKKARIRTQVAAGLAMATLLVGGFAWQKQQQSERDELIRDSVLEVTTPEIVQKLSQRLPNYLKVADKAKDAGNVEKALADYQFLVSLKRLERDINANSEEFANLSKERQIIQDIAAKAENSLAGVISQHRLPQLEEELRKGNFGKLKESESSTPGSPEFGDFSQHENQYTGALRTTYAILKREKGAHADRNNDGYLTEGEEELLPCQTLKEIEYLWRKFTEGRCGWFGSEDFLTDSDCHELEGNTLTYTLIFPPSIYLIEKRLNEQCQVVYVSNNLGDISNFR